MTCDLCQSIAKDVQSALRDTTLQVGCCTALLEGNRFKPTANSFLLLHPFDD